MNKPINFFYAFGLDRRSFSCMLKKSVHNDLLWKSSFGSQGVARGLAWQTFDLHLDIRLSTLSPSPGGVGKARAITLIRSMKRNRLNIINNVTPG